MNYDIPTQNLTEIKNQSLSSENEVGKNENYIGGIVNLS